MNRLEVTGETPLFVRRLVWPRTLLLALWALVAVSFLAVFVVDLAVSYPLLALPCSGPDCHYQAVTDAEAAVLTLWDLPVPAYALYMLAISVVPVLLFTVVAVVTLARLYPQPRGFLFSLMLIIIPVVAITSFDVAATAERVGRLLSGRLRERATVEVSL